MAPSILNPPVPYVGSLPCPLEPKNLIRISGSVPDDAICFSINLQNGNNIDQRSDIALHLSPVFSSPPRIVRNSLENQQWGPEESYGSEFPLSRDQAFEILILPEIDHFKIAVNGKHFTEFQYRLPLQSVSCLAIDGDVIINSINFESIAQSPMNQGGSEEVTKPLGFVIDSGNQSIIPPPAAPGRPSSPYNMSSLPYPTNLSFGPAPTAYSPPSPSNTYNPYPPPPNYGPAPQSGAYPSGSTSPYAQHYPPNAYSPQGHPGQMSGFPPPHGGYPSPQGVYPSPQGGYPSPQGGYPSQGMHPYPSPYPGQPGTYPGQHVVYPDQEKKSSSGMNLGPLAAAGAAALAGVAGSTLMGGKHKKNKHGHGIPGMGAAPGALLGGVTSLLGGNKKGHSGSSSFPIGGAMAGGAAALAGAYMLNKSPVGKMMKPKKMKKLYKHKGGWGSSSSSSSSSD